MSNSAKIPIRDGAAEALLMTVTQASHKMGITGNQVRNLIREGRLAHVKIGRRVMIPRGAIEEFIVDNTVQPCRGETLDPAFASSKGGDAFTFAGLNQVAAGSAARALQMANKLKSSSLNSFTSESAKAALRTPRKSS